MANLEEIVRRVRIEYVTSGEKEVARALGQLAVSQQTVAASSETITKAQTGAERAYARVRRELDAAAKAQDIFVRQTLDMKRAVEAGLISTIKEFNAFGDAAKRAFEKAGSATSGADPTKMLGISLSGASAQKSAAAFEAHFKHLEDMAELHAEQIGKQFGESLDRSLIAGVAKSARDSASVFETEFKRLDEIATLRAQHTGQEFARALNERMRIGAPAKSAQASASVFQDIEREAKALDQLKAELDPAIKARQAYDVQSGQIQKHLAAGNLTLEESIGLQVRAQAAMDRSVGAHKSLGAAAGLTSYQMQNLGFQINDVITGIASGQRPLQVLTQQFGQFLQIAQSAQGGWSAIGRQILAWVSPAKLAIAAAVAIGAAAILAARAWEDAQFKIQVALTGIGRLAGATVGDIDNIAKSVSILANISINAARDIAAQLAATGKIGRDMIGPIAATGKDVAKTFGTDLEGAGALLAKAFADPAKGVKDLGDRLGFLDDQTRDYIVRLSALNDKSEAQRALLAYMKDNLGKASELTSGWAQAWDKVANAAKEAWDWLGKIAAKGLGSDAQGAIGPEREVADLKARIESYQQAAESKPGMRSGAQAYLDKTLLPALAEAEKRVADLREQTAIMKVDGEKAAIALLAGDVTKQLVPYITTYDELIKKKGELTAAIANKKGLDDIGATGIALAKVNTALSDYGERGDIADFAARKLAAGLALNKQAVDATTVAQLGQLAADRKRVELMGSEETQAQRTVLIEQARKESILEAEKAITAQNKALDASAVKQDTAAEALKRAGVGAAEQARARKQAEEEFRTGQATDIEGRTLAILRENLSRVNEQRAEGTRTMQDQNTVQQALNKQVAAGNITSERAQELLATEAEARRVESLAMAATGEQQQVLLQRAAELRQENQRGLDIKQKTFLLAGSEQNQRALDLAKTERDLIFATDEARVVALARKQTELELTAKMIPLTDELAKKYIGEKEALAKLTLENQKLGQAIQFVEGLGSNFASTAASGFFTSGTTQIEDLNTFKRVMDQAGDSVQANLAVGLERAAKAMTAMAAAGKNLASSLASKGFETLFKTDTLAALGKGNYGAALSGAGMAVGGSLMGMGLQRGSMLLSVGGGALAGAAAGSMVSPGIGTAVGAAVGAGLGLVTGLMQQSANKQQRLLQIQQATLEAAQRLKEKAESAAARQAAFQDQLFISLQNPDTLEGQLAIFDRQSQRAREAETKAGGEAMVDLEANIAEGRLGIIRDFAEQAVAVEEKRLDILEAQQSFQDRLFAATNKSDTLEGALALFDRSAQREREAETAAGGEAINDLEAALAAERLNIITDFADRAAEVEKQNAERAAAAAAEAAAAINESNKTALEAAISARDAQIQAATDAAQAAERIANEAAERQRAIADRQRNFADRAYLAAQNTSTLEGALAAFDLRSLRERQAEMRNGGEAITELETALAQERLNIIADFAQRALEEQQRTAEEQQRALEEQQKRQRDAVQDAKDFFTDLTRSLRKFIDDLKGGANSPLSPKDRLAAAQTAYDAQLALAQGGNRDALSGISGYAQTLLDASRDYNASGPAYQDTFNTVISQLEELPALVDPIVAAIEQQTIDLLSGFGVKAAGGGWISGGGTGTSDSINASLSNGEFVVRSSVAAQNPWLGDFNRYGTMPSNDNGSMLQRLDAIERTLAVVGNAVVAATTEGAASVVTATTRGHAKSAEAVRLAESRPRRTGT